MEDPATGKLLAMYDPERDLIQVKPGRGPAVTVDLREIRERAGWR